MSAASPSSNLLNGLDRALERAQASSSSSNDEGASITRAKRSRVKLGSRALRRTLGIPLKMNIAATVQRPAKRTVHSNITGTNAGQELKGLPPTLMGQSTAEVQY